MKFYGQWNPPVDKVLYESYFINKKHGFFIECGAVDGVIESSCKFFEESLDWSGINIEPVPKHFEKLCINRPGCLNINIALSNTEEVMSFTNVIHPEIENFGNGSIKHTEKHLNILKQIGCKFEVFQVKTTTFASLINSFDFKQIDLFVLDVEGYEPEVIKGMKGAMVLPEVICIEYSITGSITRPLLEEMGYKYNKESFNNAFFIKGDTI